ncbi:hypothetical protein M758_4G036100 [Ceratodon purpureus]|nr:hypothetical protein KC19_4G039200 [Ceratodon purpureus]KAG0578651.1 hypothetical protein KC19_4G039200 [Ceratodon purpureus]KAG0618068.1 hypothetical protein M758_4G036100 [Ceratodon purpureus]KAG0618069.1 hypothetical protein M758_4G036100 [Ceratodon purpureus]
MAMESRLLHHASPLVSNARAGAGEGRSCGNQGFRLSSSQRFMRGVAVRPAQGVSVGSRRERRGARSVVVAARRPVQEQQEYVEAKNDTAEYVESTAEAHGSGSSYIGSPLLWIGVGVGLSALFSFGANSVKRYAMQQMLKSMTGGAGGPGASPFGGPGANPFGAPGANPFGAPGANPFAGMPMPPPGAGFPFPMPPTGTPPSPVSAAAAAPPVDVAPSNVASSQPSVKSESSTTSAESRKTAFTDVNASEILEREQQAAARFRDQAPSASEPTRSFFADSEVVDSRGGSNSGAGAGPSSNESWTNAGKGKQPVFTVDQLEKMMEDPTVQKMVYP